jgi:hypothetical protein
VKNPHKLSIGLQSAILYVGRYETDEFGAIIKGNYRSLLARGYVVMAERRPFARPDGICVRLTDKGREYMAR